MQERRKFLTVLSASAATMGLNQILGCGSDGGSSQPTGTVAGGKASDLAVGSVTKMSGQSILLGRDAQGLYAMTAICTHEDCDLSGSSGVVNSSGILCTCHNSQFDKVGNVVSGPARSALAHYAVTIAADGTLSVNADQKVAATTRTAVPA